MKSINEERLDEYNEEIRLIDEGIKAYEAELSKGIVDKATKKYELKYKVFGMNLNKKSKIAASLQLGDLMNQQEAQMKKDTKEMKENFKKVLKNCMDIKDKLPRDRRMQVLGIKNTEDNRAWHEGNEHKVSMYKFLKNLLQQYPNGKSI